MVHAVLLTILLSSIKSTQTRQANETCQANAFSNRDYLKEEEVNGIISPIPLLLMSNPGSGSTLTRLLLEYATGLYTGSIYTDANLAQVLPGERFCGLRLTAIKSYPADVVFANNTNEPCFTIRDKEMKRKCKKCVITEFPRVIVLIRDPYHSIWAAYQRTMYTTSHPTQQQPTNDGTSSSSSSNDETSRLHKKRKVLLLLRDVGIDINAFQKDHWEKAALNSMQAFAKTWHEVYANIFKFFKNWNVHVVRYEDLTNSTHHHVQLDALRNTIKFMRHWTNESRIRCAFDLVLMESIAANISTMVTMDQAYSNADLVCSMWNIIKNQTNLSIYGYQAYANRIC